MKLNTPVVYVIIQYQSVVAEFGSQEELIRELEYICDNGEDMDSLQVLKTQEIPFTKKTKVKLEG